MVHECLCCCRHWVQKCTRYMQWYSKLICKWSVLRPLYVYINHNLLSWIHTPPVQRHDYFQILRPEEAIRILQNVCSNTIIRKQCIKFNNLLYFQSDSIKFNILVIYISERVLISDLIPGIGIKSNWFFKNKLMITNLP